MSVSQGKREKEGNRRKGEDVKARGRSDTRKTVSEGNLNK